MSLHEKPHCNTVEEEHAENNVDKFKQYICKTDSTSCTDFHQLHTQVLQAINNLLDFTNHTKSVEAVKSILDSVN